MDNFCLHKLNAKFMVNINTENIIGSSFYQDNLLNSAGSIKKIIVCVCFSIISIIVSNAS